MTKLEIEHGEGKADLERMHQNTTSAIFRRGKLTLTLWQTVLIIVALSSIGRATSGRWWFDMNEANQVSRLTLENVRLMETNENLTWATSWKSETLAIFYAVINDNQHLLERSRTINKLRATPFEFKDWKNPSELIKLMVNSESWNCLEWVVSQNDWHSCLDAETCAFLREWEQNQNNKEIFKNLPEKSKQAIERLADSIRKNGLPATKRFLESQAKDEKKSEVSFSLHKKR